MKGKKITLLFVVWFSCFSSLYAEKDVVVCVHGFMRTRASMLYAETALRKAGFEVVNWGYPSRKKSIADHGEDLARELQWIEERYPNRKIHFFTHSLGGLIVRSALNHPLCPKSAKLGKAVLCACPNRGSGTARSVRRLPFVQKAFGLHAGAELLEAGEDDFEALGAFPPSVEVLIVAGTKDGKVKVEETLLKTPHRFLAFPITHTWIMWSPQVLRATVDFFVKDDLCKTLKGNIS